MLHMFIIAEANHVHISASCNHLRTIELQERGDRQKCAFIAGRAMQGMSEGETGKKEVGW